jgi:hypothetical protein
MPAKTSQPSPRVLAARRNGALGGKARAAKHSKEMRDKWSSKGGFVTSERYGPELKKYGSTLRKTVGRYRTPVEHTKLAKRRKVIKQITSLDKLVSHTVGKKKVANA